MTHDDDEPRPYRRLPSQRPSPSPARSPGLTLFSSPTKAASVSEVTLGEVGDLVVDAGGSKAVGFKGIKEIKGSREATKIFVFEWESVRGAPQWPRAAHSITLSPKP